MNNECQPGLLTKLSASITNNTCYESIANKRGYAKKITAENLSANNTILTNLMSTCGCVNLHKKLCNSKLAQVCLKYFNFFDLCWVLNCLWMPNIVSIYITLQCSLNSMCMKLNMCVHVNYTIKKYYLFKSYIHNLLFFKFTDKRVLLDFLILYPCILADVGDYNKKLKLKRNKVFNERKQQHHKFNQKIQKLLVH